MRLLILGSLAGQLGAASRIAIGRGAKVLHAEDLAEGLKSLRSGEGADLVLVDVSLDVRRPDRAACGPSGSPFRWSPAASATTRARRLPRSGPAPGSTCRCRPIPS